MLQCSVCENALRVTAMACPSCALEVGGEFYFPALLRLAPASLALAEALILAGGNLKTLAQELEISYPTVRKRIDGLINDLQAIKQQDQQQIEAIVQGMEEGSIQPSKGIRMIREINGDL